VVRQREREREGYKGGERGRGDTACHCGGLVGDFLGCDVGELTQPRRGEAEEREEAKGKGEGGKKGERKGEGKEGEGWDGERSKN
jgi:hypothetical protein